MGITLTLGTFSITGEKMHVSDPCYAYDCKGAITLEKVLSGEYEARIAFYREDIWGVRVTSLSVWHVSHKDITANICVDSVIGVDSGQAGFFDDDYYEEKQGGDFGDLTRIFGLSCSLTLSKNHGGITEDKGVVSETGFGDGCYSLYIGKIEAGQVVSASIVFIEEEEMEEC